VEMGRQILETTGNRQIELAFDTFCVGGTKNEKLENVLFFLCPPHRSCQMPAPFDVSKSTCTPSKFISGPFVDNLKCGPGS
jgi:hypothetical protein